MEIREENSRLVLLDGSKFIGEMTWEDKGDYFIINHTAVNPEYQGQGLAGKLVAAGVEKARREGRKIFPTCPFAVREFDTKSEYADVRRMEL